MVVGSEAGAEGLAFAGPVHPVARPQRWPSGLGGETTVTGGRPTWSAPGFVLSTSRVFPWPGRRVRPIPHPFTDEETEAQLVIAHGQRQDLHPKPKL